MSKIQIQVSHVAFVLPDAEFAAERLATFGYPVGPVEVFPEGTKEIYVGRGFSAALLLMEPVAPGSYEKALLKRGPGLHHIALDVLNIEKFLSQALAAGWILHANSEDKVHTKKEAWLYRPGFPTLIEVVEVKSFLSASQFVSALKLNFNSDQQVLVDALGLQDYIQKHSGLQEARLMDQVFVVSDWLG